MDKLLLSGNEAIALGAFESGVQVGTGYPGTPSTEILENLTTYPGVYTEWSVNEKVALEVAIGAAIYSCVHLVRPRGHVHHPGSGRQGCPATAQTRRGCENGR